MSVEAKAAKQLIIDEIKGKLEDAQSLVVIDYMGLTVDETTRMRKKLREANVDYKVYKNTLFKRAIEGTKYEEVAQVLDGPSAFAVSKEDATAPARVLKEIIEDYKKMAFKAGVVEGTYYDAEGIKVIADIPGRETLIAKFLGSIQSPISKAARTFQAIADAKADGSFDAKMAEAQAKKADAPAEEAAPAGEEPAAEAAAAEETASEEAKTEE